MPRMHFDLRLAHFHPFWNVFQSILFPRISVKSSPGALIVRETEKVLDEKITTRTEEVPCPLTGIPHLRTVEVVEKIIETEVKTQQTISCTACEFNSSHRRFVVFRTTNVLILFHFCFSHTFSPSLFHWNICLKKIVLFPVGLCLIFVCYCRPQPPPIPLGLFHHFWIRSFLPLRPVPWRCLLFTRHL